MSEAVTTEKPAIAAHSSDSRGSDGHCAAHDETRPVPVYPEAIAAIEGVLGRSVRTDFHTTVGYSLPDPDARHRRSGTYNMINKWAAGIADTYVTGRRNQRLP